MKNFIVVVVALMLLMGCEAPQAEQNETLTYKGHVVETGTAPFLIQNGLAKDEGKDNVVIEETSSDVAVYGLLDDSAVYLAAGGETLPGGTWIGSLDGEPIEVSVLEETTVVFETLTEVTVLDADNIIYIDADEISVTFSGDGVITTSEISTGSKGSVTLVTTVQFSIGGTGGEPG